MGAPRKWYQRTGVWSWMVYAAVRTAFGIMQIFPIDWNLRTARLGARCWRHLMPRHYRRAVDHLTGAFAPREPAWKIDRLARQCLESVAMFAVEAICLPRLVRPSSWHRYIRLARFDEMVRLQVNGRGAILVTGHYGSFELVGHLLACLRFDLAAVMRPLDNAYLNRFLVRSRKANGMTLLDKKGATAQAEELLRKGTMLGFIGDQDAGRKGVFVDFFGRAASTYKSIGLLAMSTESPIVVGYARRCGDRARYEIAVERVIHPTEWTDQKDPLRWITQEYTAAIERVVRRDPAQYLWIHRRWKSRPR